MSRVTIVRPESTPASVELPIGASLFEAGARAQAAIDTACVGKGTCGLCRVKILGGAEHLVPFSDEERKHLGNVYHLTKVRLACRARLVGDGEVTIEIVRKKR
ncbi:MAG TPA: 2Fe-2S iron-sulfur cluster-binding protein [Kofleriaceae bacterium]|nr:2Fe-2S iron-sulfur cluster-binding protein [Kofleriaceae bacterium]